MKITRQSAWQTNSSSSHSICINKNNVSFSTITPDDSGAVRAHTSQYGWQQDSYSDTGSKLSYAATWVMAYHMQQDECLSDVIVTRQQLEDQNRLAKQALQILEQKQTKSTYLLMLAKVVMRHTGADLFVIQRESGYYPFGYIDHQSDYVCGQAFKDEDTLKSFIFGNGSSFMTDNDNH